MSVSAAHADKFKEQVVTEERAFTVRDDGQLLVYRVGDGETVPFWSSRSRVETIQKRFPKYRRWQISELSLADFWRCLDNLERDGINVGVNWSGQQLTGYDVPVAELRAGLGYWLDKLDKRKLLEPAT
jgi:hypothetical protein